MSQFKNPINSLLQIFFHKIVHKNKVCLVNIISLYIQLCILDSKKLDFLKVSSIFKLEVFTKNVVFKKSKILNFKESVFNTPSSSSDHQPATVYSVQDPSSGYLADQARAQPTLNSPNYWGQEQNKPQNNFQNDTTLQNFQVAYLIFLNILNIRLR